MKGLWELKKPFLPIIDIEDTTKHLKTGCLWKGFYTDNILCISEFESRIIE